MSDTLEKLKALLDSQQTWPGDYLFKFIVKKEFFSELSALFPGQALQTRKSGKGTYISVTVTLRMNSSEEVVKIYRKAASIPGLIAL